MFDFETVIRNRVRFETPKGLLTVEDLFDLPLTSTTGKANLDDIAKALFVKVRDGSGIVSFVEDVPAEKSADAMRLDVVKYVIAVRKGDNRKALDAVERKAKRERIMAFIAERKDAEMKGKSLEELDAMLKELG